MYVCLCRGVTDGHIREAISAGCCSYRDVRNVLGVATQCGKCACQAKGVVRETLSTLGASQPSHPGASLAYNAAVA
ncbi:bacterioferritin-associated ferredoxin [Stutzerimonas tarimensis]|uniref:Bacterioferritin-associated ferredoxin n=1 Tax=Stutzerimonas tarimensis TaxID=1507735 RepID=A0ABV7T024_9GAMM